jgi:hypothetical protein
LQILFRGFLGYQGVAAEKVEKSAIFSPLLVRNPMISTACRILRGKINLPAQANDAFLHDSANFRLSACCVHRERGRSAAAFPDRDQDRRGSPVRQSFVSGISGASPGSASRREVRRRLQRCAHERHAIGDAAASCIDRQMIAIPGMIVTPDHGRPIGQDQAGDFSRPGFNSATMLFDVGA